MNISKTTKILVAVIAAVFLVVALVLYFIKGNGDSADQPTGITVPLVSTAPPVSTAQIIVTGYDVSGTWYSDRENGDTLILETDGSYTSLNWLAAGSYTVAADNRIIKFTDLFGDINQLTLVASGDTYVMKYEGSAAHTYYRTMQEATAAQEAQKAAAEEMRSFYDAALLQILTTGEWLSLDETATLNFTDSVFIIEFAGTQFVESTTREYSYVITNVSFQNGHYSVKMDLHDKTSSLNFNNSGVGITISEDNTYTLICGNFAFAQKYQKTVKIEFTQESTGANGGSSVTDDDIIAENVIEDDTAEIAALVEQEIYGIWKGTFEEMPTVTTVYWEFVFSPDGTYRFTRGDSFETGSFTLTHNNDKYHSTLCLVPNAALGEAEAKERRFYFSDSFPISMTIEGDSHPTYFKQ